jgi:hypothetical protein
MVVEESTEDFLKNAEECIQNLQRKYTTSDETTATQGPFNPPSSSLETP